MDQDMVSSIGSFSVFKQEGVRQFYCRWTEKEDELLVNAVKKYGPHKWSLISQVIPGRTPAQCSTRWHGALNSTVHKGRWSPDEDEILIKCVRTELKSNNNDTNRLPWNAIAKSIPHRTGIQCQSRWTEALDPTVRKGRWDKYEDELLRKSVHQLGCCWIRVAHCIPSRTQRQCRTRWNQIRNTRRPSKRQPSSSLPSTSPTSPTSTTFPAIPKDSLDHTSLFLQPSHSTLNLTLHRSSVSTISSSSIDEITLTTHPASLNSSSSASFFPSASSSSSASTVDDLLDISTPSSTSSSPPPHMYAKLSNLPSLTSSSHPSITMPDSPPLSPPTSIPAMIIPTSTAMELPQILLPSHHSSITIPKDPYSFLLDHHPSPFLAASSVPTTSSYTSTTHAAPSPEACIPNVRHLDASLSWLFN